MRRMGNYQEAKNYLDQMVKKFGEDYNIINAWQFLEIDYQETKSNAQRNYQTFAE